MPAISGSIVDTTNIADKTKNTYSARVIDMLLASSSGGDSLPIGSCMVYFGTIAPTNYMFADGTAISRTEYSELFAIIGTLYGAGDGSTTFNLPDKRIRVSVPMKADDDTFNKLGKTGGEKTHKLTISEMPSHNHGVSIVSASNVWGPNYSNGISHKEVL